MTILADIPLKNKTTFKIGGNAAFYCAPQSVADVAFAIEWARTNTAQILVLGKGSNLLVSDSGWPGLVIDMSENWNAIVWNGSHALCQSGALLHALVKESVDRGLCGFEKLAGIPGSIGGAVVMNAGAFGQCLSDCLDTVEYADMTSGEIKTVCKSDIAASYRSSIFKSNTAIILSASFNFCQDTAGTYKASYLEVLAKRKDRHPLELPNCGSVFKNPPDTTAGKLIESCGLKGMRIGGAEVSQKHANFIVNVDNAKALDVWLLIESVQKKVQEKTGIMLEREVVCKGEFVV